MQRLKPRINSQPGQPGETSSGCFFHPCESLVVFLQAYIGPDRRERWLRLAACLLSDEVLCQLERLFSPSCACVGVRQGSERERFSRRVGERSLEDDDHLV